MNAPFPKPEQSSDKIYSAMTGHADKWRGECIGHFARMERIIDDLLCALR
jgi:hypothetical protein